MTKFVVTRLQSQRQQHCAMRDATQCQDDRPAARLRDFRSQELIARANFCRVRLILRWQAFHCVGDAAVDHFQAIVHRHRNDAIGETKFVERTEQENTRVVTGKWAAGTSGTVQTRGQADD